MAASFLMLLRDAAIVDHPTIESVFNLIPSFQDATILDLVSLADDLYDVRADFLDRMDAHAKRLAKRPTVSKWYCPYCGDGYCPAAAVYSLKQW